MSDIFREVEEEVRRERFEQIWKQYGDYIIAAVAVVIIAIAGFELWQRYEANQNLKASDTLIAAQDLAESGNVVKSSEALATLARRAPGSYDKIARLSHAEALLASGQRMEAVAIYKSVAADDSGPIGSLALLRAGWAMADSAPRTDLASLLAPLTDPKSPWRHPAHEVLAYADFHAGNTRAAQTEFAMLGDDKDAPESLRRRAAAMASFLKNGGMANFGTVPPLQPETPPGAAPAPGTAPQ